ncbi:hypothetical protein QZH41_002746 [Actinostola sp. cb2023]|nr:hypothetical protein QZH41_002746 [Actinostola sp. cb2023]
MLIIYDAAFSYHSKNSLSVVTKILKAHDAGIICMCLARDTDNNTWILTGGFDKVVKVWSQDGQAMHKFDGFCSAITAVCYVRPLKTIWIAGGSVQAAMYDPKSGDNVSDFIGTFQNEDTTRKVPILIFSGGSDGNVTKWERLQSNNFMYSKELLLQSEAKARLAAQLAEKYDIRGSSKPGARDVTASYRCKPSFVNTINRISSSSEHTCNVALLRSVFVENLDLLVVASEDHNIYVWGFDENAVSVLQNMRPADESLIYKYAILLEDKNFTKKTDDENPKDQDSVTNRVAGFICKHVFTDHTNCVTGLAVVGKEAGFGTTYLISAGWDRRILLWDLEKARFHDAFRNADRKSSENEELASDGIIMDLTYSCERNEFAYASSDKLVYIRKFSNKGNEMTLSAVLQGHEAEVTQVKWSSVCNKWVTGSEDGTIRVWVSNA